jgi:uncharacterized protein
LRALVLEPAPAGSDDVAVLEFEVDDMSGEEIGVGLDLLRAAPGVLDASVDLRLGKKGRPMQGFRLLARPETVEAVERLCFAETSTLGVRRRLEQRTVLPRRAEGVTLDGTAGPRVKLAARPDGEGSPPRPRATTAPPGRGRAQSPGGGAMSGIVPDRLLEALDRHDALAIAVSGGQDSMTLAHVAHRFARGVEVTLFHAASPAVPGSARGRLERHAAREGWRLVLVDAGELADPRYAANPVDRCYFCKTNVYDRIRRSTDAVIASGTNTDDLDDFRPGLRAAAEREVVHPYVEAGIGKAGIKALARELGLADLTVLPAQPCLASRIETGIAVTAEHLAFVELVEAQLTALLGEQAIFRCRVTHAGAVVELDAALLEARPVLAGQTGALAMVACAEAGRRFAGVRPYRRGAAFRRG